AFDLDVNSSDSIKSTAKSLASGIVAAYNSQPKGSAIGIFDDLYYWWEAGAVWGGMIEYSHLTGDSQYNALVSTALWSQIGDEELRAYMPPNQTKTLGNDDQSTWGLAALTAAEVGFQKPEQGEWVDLAKNVFDTQAVRWDEKTCGGGLRWQIFTFNNGYNYKNSFSTGNLFLLSARLAQLTGNKTYSEWADKSFKWMQDVGLISDTYHVFDGTDSATNCSQINHIQWTYAHGVCTEGAAVMYNLTNGDAKWKDAVTGFVNASTVFLNKDTSVLTEVACETSRKCDIDQKAFKGIAVRSFARAALSAPFASNSLRKMLETSAKGAAKSCGGGDTDVKCDLKWYGEDSNMTSVKDGGLGEVFGALEVVQALLYPQAEAGAKGNSTNPAVSASGSPSATGG
ncbi:glycoside hydrolase, partial [Lindgomyces ingoldianus]